MENLYLITRTVIRKVHGADAEERDDSLINAQPMNRCVIFEKRKCFAAVQRHVSKVPFSVETPLTHLVCTRVQPHRSGGRGF